MCYFACAINSDRYETISRSLGILEAHKTEFDAIAFTGISGACIAPILAYSLGKELLPIRKPTACGEHSHGTSGVVRWWQENQPSYRVVLVDDFISDGKTARGMIAEVLKWSPHSKVVAMFVYKPLYAPTAAPQKEAAIGIPLWWWSK